MIIVGDINIDLLVENTHQVEFLTLIQSFACFNRINTPTRVTATSSTLLDPCITNVHPDDVLSGVITAGISDHMPIFCILPKLKKVNNTPVSRLYRYISEEALNTFYALLQEQNWENVLCERNPDKAYNLFYETLKDSYETSFPLRSKKQTGELESHGSRRNYSVGWVKNIKCTIALFRLEILLF